MGIVNQAAELYRSEPIINLKAGSPNHARPAMAANTAIAFTSTPKP
jgi:hypothetical protein